MLDKFAAIQMVDAHFPTTDGRTLILSRYTQPEADQKLLLQKLRLQLTAPTKNHLQRLPSLLTSLPAL